MLWWTLVLALFGFWILALAAGYTFGGAVHGLLLAGLAATAFRTWRERSAEPPLTPRRRNPPNASSAGKPRAGRP